MNTIHTAWQTAAQLPLMRRPLFFIAVVVLVPIVNATIWWEEHP